MVTSAIDLGGITASAGPILTGVLGIGVLIAVGLGVYLVATQTGILTRRDIKCVVFAKRANGGVELKFPKGRFLKNGLFEIAYDNKNVDKIEAPSEEFIYPGNMIIFSRTERDTHWPSTIRIDESKVTVEPAVLPAGKMALANEIETDIERFKEQDKMEKYMPYIALIIAGLLIGAGFYFGFADVAKAQHENAQAISGFTEKLTNMTIVNRVVADPSVTTISNRPAG